MSRTGGSEDNNAVSQYIASGDSAHFFLVSEVVNTFTADSSLGLLAHYRRAFHVRFLSYFLSRFFLKFPSICLAPLCISCASRRRICVFPRVFRSGFLPVP